MATDAVDFRGAVGTFFSTAWAGTTPVAWPGRDFDIPTDYSSWVRMSIFESDTRQIEIGTPNNMHFRESGVIIFQIFTESDKGDGPALTLGDQIATIFRKQRVTYTNGRVIFRAPQVRVIGATTDVNGTGDAGNWFQVNVSIPYIRDNIA